jgi:eukaryotic-like serine/threonine-protein kinase
MSGEYKPLWTRSQRSQRAQPAQRSQRSDEGGPGLPIVVWFLVAVGLFAAGYALAVFVLFPPPPVPEDGIVVPDLNGSTVAVARSRLEPLGLVIGDTLRIPNAKTARGLVVAQSPLPGQQLRAGGRVAVGLSSGLPTVAVPDVVGMGVSRAETLLKRLGFQVEQSSEMASEPNGTVIRSEPQAGTRRSVPARVQLVVSTGTGAAVDTLPVHTDTVKRDTITVHD